MVRWHNVTHYHRRHRCIERTSSLFYRHIGKLIRKEAGSRTFWLVTWNTPLLIMFRMTLRHATFVASASTVTDLFVDKTQRWRKYFFCSFFFALVSSWTSTICASNHVLCARKCVLGFHEWQEFYGPESHFNSVLYPVDSPAKLGSK